MTHIHMDDMSCMSIQQLKLFTLMSSCLHMCAHELPSKICGHGMHCSTGGLQHTNGLIFTGNAVELRTLFLQQGLKRALTKLLRQLRIGPKMRRWRTRARKQS